MTAPTAPAWPPSSRTAYVTWTRARMAFACTACLDPYDGEAHKSCQDVADYFHQCRDLDDSLSRRFIENYSSVDRPRVIWFPLAIGVEMICTIQKVPLSELGRVGWANREAGVSQLAWPVRSDASSRNPATEWMYEVRDLRGSIGLRRRSSLSSRDVADIVKLRAGAQSSAPVLIDPEDSFLKFIRIQRDIYSSTLHYYEGLEKILNKRLPPCTAPEPEHRVAGAKLRDDIKEIAQRLHGPEGLEMYNAWRMSQPRSDLFSDVIREVVIGYSYSMVTDQVCLQCAKLSEPVPDFAVPKL